MVTGFGAQHRLVAVLEKWKLALMWYDGIQSPYVHRD